MKKFFKVTILASAVSLLAACGQEAPAAPVEKTTKVADQLANEGRKKATF